MGWKWKLLPLFIDGHASEKSPSSFRKTYIKDSDELLSKSFPKWLRFALSVQEASPNGTKVLTDDVAVICICTSWGKEPHIYLLQNMLSALFINLVNSNLVCRQTHNFIWTSASYLLWSGTAPGPDPPLIPESAGSKVKCIYLLLSGWLHSNKAYFFAAEVSFRRTLYNTNFSPEYAAAVQMFLTLGQSDMIRFLWQTCFLSQKHHLSVQCLTVASVLKKASVL